MTSAGKGDLEVFLCSKRICILRLPCWKICFPKDYRWERIRLHPACHFTHQFLQESVLAWHSGELRGEEEEGLYWSRVLCAGQWVCVRSHVMERWTNTNLCNWLLIDCSQEISVLIWERDLSSVQLWYVNKIQDLSEGDWKGNRESSRFVFTSEQGCSARGSWFYLRLPRAYQCKLFIFQYSVRLRALCFSVPIYCLTIIIILPIHQVIQLGYF